MSLRLNILKSHIILKLVMSALIVLIFCHIKTENTYAATNSVTIYLGYFGQQYSQFENKGTFSASAMAACGAGTYKYSAIDNGGYIRYGAGSGYYLSSILQMAGIDISSVQSISLRAADGYTMYERAAWGSNGLFNTRYCFPNLGTYLNGGDGWAGASAVPTILAYSSCLERVEGNINFTEQTPLPMSGDTALRLMFGQVSPNQVTANESAKYVQTIYVRYSGAAPGADAKKSDTSKAKDTSSKTKTEKKTSSSSKKNKSGNNSNSKNTTNKAKSQTSNDTTDVSNNNSQISAAGVGLKGIKIELDTESSGDKDGAVTVDIQDNTTRVKVIGLIILTFIFVTGSISFAIKYRREF